MPQIIIRERTGSVAKMEFAVSKIANYENVSDKIINLTAAIVNFSNKSAKVEVTETEVIIDLES